LGGRKIDLQVEEEGRTETREGNGRKRTERKRKGRVKKNEREGQRREPLTSAPDFGDATAVYT